ncbi:hypothetical protein E8D37_12195 [Nocardioides sp. GY 10127]|nr:hypothetical protein E8D37_12195 [Nocardioides sp. GY 10127]
MLTEQDHVLAAVGSPEPVYRWTTALNGVAVRLTSAEATTLATRDDVSMVERSSLRRPASVGRRAATASLASAAATVTGADSPGSGSAGGAGTVVGVVDTGLDADSAVFADVPALGAAPTGFSGTCEGEDAWPAASCAGKVVTGRWFVAGFGEHRLSSGASLSPLDTDGHGTLVSSIAAGNAGVTVRVGEESLGSWSGVAPQARVAVYKACWTAPDPDDDGCSTADLVTAIDAAATDGVDVLELAVGGPSRLDTVETALLGAREAGAVVVAAAGNGGARATAAHPSPWVVTVGAVRAAQRRGEVVATTAGGAAGPVLDGAMAASEGVTGRLVRGADVAAPGASTAAARLCEPGSLDAGRVRGRVVLCLRGGVGRVDKSAAVAAADGVGMVLVNTGHEGVDADLHTVPTVHLAAADGRRLTRWLATHPAADVRLRPEGLRRARARVAGFSASGSATSTVLKPDVVADGTDVLGVVPAGVSADRWSVLSGTSAASAVVAGAAARLAASTGLEAGGVASLLVARAEHLPGVPVLRQGSGRVLPEADGTAVGLVVPRDAALDRAWLAGTAGLQTDGIVVRAGGSAATRTLVNAGRATRTWRVTVRGAEGVTARPATVRVAPGRRASIRVRSVGGTAGQGAVVLTATDGSGLVTRLPLLVRR